MTASKSPVVRLEELELSGFRAYLRPQTFLFRSKPCLAVLAPNGSGKSALVDALEFLLSPEGTLKRLGLRAVNNQAGVTALAHNLAEEQGIPSCVRALFRLGDSTYEGTRPAVGASRLRPAPIGELLGWLPVPPIIRGHELRRFVEEETPEVRYASVAGWLNLDPLVKTQRLLRSLRTRLKALITDSSDLRHLDSQLAKETAGTVREWNDAIVLTFANNLLAKSVGPLTLKALSATDPAALELEELARADEARLGLQSLRQLRRAAASIHVDTPATTDGSEPSLGRLSAFRAAVDALAASAGEEAQAKREAADACFADLWDSVGRFFAEGAEVPTRCPVCLTPVDACGAGGLGGIRAHISARQKQLATYAAAKQRLEGAHAELTTVWNQLMAALQALVALLTDAHVVARTEVNAFLDEGKELQGAVACNPSRLRTALAALTTALDIEIRAKEMVLENEPLGGTLRRIQSLVELRNERSLLLRRHEQLSQLSVELQRQSTIVSGKVRTALQGLLDTLQTPLKDIYQSIQGLGASPVRLELPPPDETNQQRLSLVIDFSDNRIGVQPAGYLSDSQVHSLALALRLAAIKRFNTSMPLVALDDVVTSYDADHRRAIAALLATQFQGFQIIVTTHDERFFLHLKDQLDEREWAFRRITSRDADWGPRFADHKVTSEMVEARWKNGESAANEMRQAEEEWLLGVCREFGASVRIRAIDRAYSYDRSELADALAATLRGFGMPPPSIPGVNNRFLGSLQRGVVENFGSHFQDAPYSAGSIGDERTRWAEFLALREHFKCPRCGGARFKRPPGMARPVCARENCEAQFEFRGTA